jgi:hypothetical protein
MLNCTNCGTNAEPEYYNGLMWVNLIVGATAPYVGMSYKGGVVFYLLVSGDSGYHTNT